MATPSGTSLSWWGVHLRRLDAYPKTMEDFRIQTRLGGGITLTAIGLIILLFALEIRSFLVPGRTEELLVDTSRGHNKLSIHLDLVVHRISCHYLSLDTMDLGGEQHIGIDHNIYKTRLDLDGKPLEEPKKEKHLGETKKIVNATKKEEASDDKKSTTVVCGSCYGAETPTKPCCNTCEEVREAYSLKTWKFDPRGVEQCKGSTSTEEEERALKEGCHIYGDLEVHRVGGSFHVGPGKSFSINHVHVHDVQPFASTDFNLTHTVRHLSFGAKLETEEGTPLDGVVGFAEKGATMFQYYLKIVPTTYVREDGSLFYTNQYSVTRHQKVVSMLSGESGMPGVFFQYELAPFMVKYSQKQKSLGHFLSGLCAIIGGVFTVAGILDKLLYTSTKIIQKKS